MAKEDILKDIKSLIEDIDKCTGDFIREAQGNDVEKLASVYCDMERLMVAAHQELSFLYDYIKEGGSNG